jgi:hypothetical protein
MARGSDNDGPNQGVLTSLLNEMDGIEEMSGVITVAATNRPDVLVSPPQVVTGLSLITETRTLLSCDLEGWIESSTLAHPTLRRARISSGSVSRRWL